MENQDTNTPSPALQEAVVAPSAVVASQKLPGTIELLKASIDEVLARPEVYFVLSLILAIPSVIQEYFFPNIDANDFAGFASVAQYMLPLILVSAILSIVVNVLTIRASLLGTGGIEEASHNVGGNCLRYFAVSLLTGIIVLIGLLLLIIPGIIFSLWYMFGGIVALAEGKTGMSALDRSKQLVKGRMGEVFVTYLAFGLIMLVVGGIAGALLGIIGSAIPHIDVISSALITIFLTPVYYVFSVRLYRALVATRGTI